MYIDPSAGSLVLQVLAAGALSGLALASRVRRSVVDFVRSVFRRRSR